MTHPSERSLELAEIALDNSAQTCQSGASLRSQRGLDPLAKEYLQAAREIERLRIEICTCQQSATKPCAEHGTLEEHATSLRLRLDTDRNDPARAELYAALQKYRDRGDPTS